MQSAIMITSEGAGDFRKNCRTKAKLPGNKKRWKFVPGLGSESSAQKWRDWFNEGDRFWTMGRALEIRSES